jgi:GNAT superfamily N-acetyltransferase
MLNPTTVTSKEELQQILDLQHTNLVGKLSTEEWQDQGFLTVEHTMEMLEAMHNMAPSIIVKDKERVVAYALTMLRECREVIPALVPMFEKLDELQWNGKPMNEYRFYTMGQICIDKAYRGQGLFDLLYKAHKNTFSATYDLLATEIATRNKRSLRAHERVGFKTINVYRDTLDEWAVVVWDWEAI